jgi:MFS family permease
MHSTTEQAGLADQEGVDARPYPPGWLSWSMWLIPAIFYLFAFYVRVSPAVMTSELMRDFQISAKSLGTLSALYFYAYVLMQIPTGVLVDSWGPRRLLIAGVVAAAAGTFLFGLTENFTLACVARGVVGGATAVGWVITLKIVTHWFPGRRFATMSGVSLFIGNVGALVAQVPLRLLIERFAWRSVTIATAVIILAIGLLAYFGVRNDPSELHFKSYAPVAFQTRNTASLWTLLKGFKRIFGYRNTWLIFFAQGGFLGAVLSFTGLWGPPYLRARFGLPPTSAAAVCSVMIVCFAVASPIVGHLSDHLGRRKPIYVAGAAVCVAGWLFMFYAPLGVGAFVAAAGITSFSAGAIILGFAFGKESVPQQYLGTVTGATNMGNMLGPTLLQPAIGWMLDKQWSGQTANGLRVYSVSAYQSAFLLIVGWSILTVILLSLTRETYCKQTM